LPPLSTGFHRIVNWRRIGWREWIAYMPPYDITERAGLGHSLLDFANRFLQVSPVRLYSCGITAEMNPMARHLLDKIIHFINS
jgi:hypothetical protein